MILTNILMDRNLNGNNLSVFMFYTPVIFTIPYLKFSFFTEVQTQIDSFCPTIPVYTNEPFGERYAYHIVQDEHQCQALCLASNLCDAMLLEEARPRPGSQDSSGMVCSLFMEGKYTEVRGKFQSWTKRCQKGEIQ